MARELIWYPDSGAPLILTDRMAGYRVGRSVTGHGVPPVDHITDTSPLIDGEQIIDTYETGRTIQVPVMVFGPDHATYRSRLRALVSALDPRAPGHLELAQADGQRRRIQAVYAGGLEGAEERATGGDTTWYRFVLRLYCPDPFWFDPTPVTLSFSYPEPFTWFPFLPLRLSASSVLGEATLNNPGSVAAYPTWTITGPGTAVALDNDVTGEQLHLTGDLDGGTLVIVTQQGQQSITLDGVDWWDKLVDTPTMWSIPPGSTSATLELTGAAVGSSVSCSFFPRYRSAW